MVSEEPDIVTADAETEETPDEEIIPAEEEVTDNTEMVSQTVYRTETGECYHREGCIHLKTKIEVTLEEANEIGLRPCSRCNPPQ